MVDKSSYSQSDAIQKLFRVELARHLDLKHAVSGLCRAKSGGRLWIQQDEQKTDSGNRSHWHIHDSELNKLHNGVILLGFGLKPQKIIKLFNDLKERSSWCAATRLLIEGRTNVGEVGILPTESRVFFEQIRSGEFDLHTKKLSNPFLLLPQVANVPGNSLMEAILLQGVMAPVHERMLAHFIQGDITKAWQVLQTLENPPPALAQLMNLIEREYRATQELAAYLDSIPGLQEK